VVTEEPSDNGFSRGLQGRIQEECFRGLGAIVMLIGSENMPAIPLNSYFRRNDDSEYGEGKGKNYSAFGLLINYVK